MLLRTDWLKQSSRGTVVNQSINQSISRSVSQSVSQSVSLSVCQKIALLAKKLQRFLRKCEECHIFNGVSVSPRPNIAAILTFKKISGKLPRFLTISEDRTRHSKVPSYNDPRYEISILLTDNYTFLSMFVMRIRWYNNEISIP